MNFTAMQNMRFMMMYMMMMCTMLSAMFSGCQKREVLRI